MIAYGLRQLAWTVGMVAVVMAIITIIERLIGE